MKRSTEQRRNDSDNGLALYTLSIYITRIGHKIKKHNLVNSNFISRHSWPIIHDFSYQTSIAIGFRTELGTSRISEVEAEVIPAADSQGTIKFDLICLITDNN